MGKFANEPSASPGLRNKRVVALIYPDLCIFEFSQAAEVFGLKRPEVGAGWYTFDTASIADRAVPTQHGGILKPTTTLSRLISAGTIIIPGWAEVDTPVPPKLLIALRSAYQRGARVLSICSGAFVLAAAGLLDGRKATTHWRYAQLLQDRFPAVDVDPNVLYVDSGRILTSAGSAAGLDLLLHLVRRDYGGETANLVARRLVIPSHRRGGQAQFVQRPVPTIATDTLAVLMEWLMARLDQPHLVSGLARRVNMSERNFLRRFRQATGVSPADWLIERRIKLAQDLLVDTDWSVDTVAAKAGIGTAMTLRHHFRKRLDTTPSAYRATFSRR